ncbi:MAG: NAD(P)H-binding protein, partial [Candidatus Eisenbacteria bacterium]|nr:NAD(P)H-binding protein [Candidatus Eisenbacteria bacterium]
MNEQRSDRRILLTGATGYVGGRLLHALEARGARLRCLARRPERLAERVAPGTEVVGGDLLNPDSVQQALRDVHAAYYLVHSMGSGEGFEDADRRAAETFGAAAREAGVERIIYLGGLGGPGDLSPHLASRQEVGRVLRESGVATIELRASIIIGSGSLSFEMIRALTEKLPVMTTPRWVRSRAQPIGIEDVVAYLVEALERPAGENRVYEIGGPEPADYAGLMREYARQRGLRRFIIPVPVLSPRLSSLWLGLVTPLYARIGRKLVDSLRNDTVVTDTSALQAFSVRPRSLREAMQRALHNEDAEFARTRWSDALSSAGPLKSYGGVGFGSRRVDSRLRTVPVAPAAAFRPIERIGGRNGWYHADFLWRLRGLLDLVAGGAGMRRQRPHPER